MTTCQRPSTLASGVRGRGQGTRLDPTVLPLTRPPPGPPSVHPVLSAHPGRFLPSCLSQASAVISYLHWCNRFHPAPSSLQAIRTHTLVSSPGLSLQGLFNGFSKAKEQRFYKPPQPLRGPEGSPLLKQALCLHQTAPSHLHPRHSARAASFVNPSKAKSQMKWHSPTPAVRAHPTRVF